MKRTPRPTNPSGDPPSAKQREELPASALERAQHLQEFLENAKVDGTLGNFGELFDSDTGQREGSQTPVGTEETPPPRSATRPNSQTPGMSWEYMKMATQRLNPGSSPQKTTSIETMPNESRSPRANAPPEMRPLLEFLERAKREGCENEVTIKVVKKE